MKLVKKILISGFRGILNPLQVDLCDGSGCKSAILYGANGTGKSSITDGWEWITTGRIQHLAREGAGEGSYPHIAAQPHKSFVEVEFSDLAIGNVKLEFDHDRVTRPLPSSNLATARNLITHPCHIRYGDLTRFVFLRKSERYDALASLMGFVPQMEYQKSLRRVQSHLEREVDQFQKVKDDAGNRLKTHFEISKIDFDSAFRNMAQVCKKHNIPTKPSFESIRASNNKLQDALAKDPRAKKLADFGALETALRGCVLKPNLPREVLALRDAIGRVKAVQKDQLATQLLVPLFQAAEEFLTRIKSTGLCPLCGKYFDGDLLEHVKIELVGMEHLKNELDNLKNCREKISQLLLAQRELLQAFDLALEGTKPAVSDQVLENFRTAAEGIDGSIKRVRTLLSFDTTSLNDKLIENLKSEENSLSTFEATFNDTKAALLKDAANQKEALEKDPARIKLVSDANFINAGLKLIDEVQLKTAKLKKANAVLAEYTSTVNDYTSTCMVTVQKRFDEISEKVKCYFEILEKYTKGIGAPKLKLLTDQDRSVVLEVSFHGRAIQPAYKYLSESQLNSFGLSVFLASSTHFNRECGFLILDDVVNSFDAHKRPLLIELIKQHLNDRQILLMTHDRFFRELLCRRLPSWKRIDFTNYTFGVGPTMSPGRHTLKKVEDALKLDEPEEACRTFAQYMEDTLQEVAERFECELKFNRRNEYTLDTLIDRFKARIQKKLKDDHPLTQAVTDLLTSMPYRNWSTHCKNPESPITLPEVQEVLIKWKEIEFQITCQNTDCAEIVRYDGSSAFQCRCGKTQLTKKS